MYDTPLLTPAPERRAPRPNDRAQSIVRALVARVQQPEPIPLSVAGDAVAPAGQSHKYYLYCLLPQPRRGGRVPGGAALAFDAYSCILLECRRLQARVRVLPQNASGLILSFETRLPRQLVLGRIRPLLEAWNQRLGQGQLSVLASV